MFGKRLKELREIRGLSLSELAAQSGVAKSYISNMERDKMTNPSLEVMTKIASVLDITPQLLISQDKDVNKEQSVLERLALAEGINQEQLKEYKELIEFIKWRSSKKE
ncbi:transcriptional regulator [Pradoshia eiseniae]|uniref:Transcriptional regulator n=1 Tax=Pradoshia eiseniae TaxID=2064768 RepID=A0A2S7N0E9_9BACI|nr:helix-turn-helix transcriptional regulator [Pradoshia eiseniae]PQD95448.1 transcriptional regulator [Pradoshia eiseniae]